MPLGSGNSSSLGRFCMPHDPGRRRLLALAGLAGSGLLLSPSWARLPATVTGGPVYPVDAPLQAGEEGWQYIRDAVLASLNLVPVVGGFLSYLGALFIPGAGLSAEQRWQRYTDAVVSRSVFELVKADLLGLSNVAMLYRSAVASQNPAVMLSQSIAANSLFVQVLPRFQLEGQRAALLPLFAVAASLHLALLRDVILGARELGIGGEYLAQLVAQQKSAIADYTAYVDRETQSIYDAVRARPGEGAASNTPLSQLLERRSQLQVAVLDLRDTWYAFDATLHPDRVTLSVDRELYTGLIGVWDGTGAARDRFPDWTPPQAPLRSIEVTRRRVANIEVGFLDGVRMEYSNGEVLTTGQLAERNAPLRLDAGESITAATTRYRTIQGLVSLELATSRDRRYKVSGRENNFDIRVESAFAMHQLSSIRVLGRGRASARAAAGCYVLGFQLIERRARGLTLEMLRRVGPTIAPHLLDWIEGG